MTAHPLERPLPSRGMIRPGVTERPPAAVQEWFASSQQRRYDTVNGRQEWAPYGIHHARRIGSPVTACGIPALEWHIFFTHPFTAVAPNVCRQCAFVTQGVRPR